jgi:solute carrier family 35 protein E3
MTPTVLCIEALSYKKPVPRQILASILVLMTGVFLATVSDPQVTTNPMGMVVAALNVIVTSICSVWTGYLQRELKVDANQLLYSVSPHAVALLTCLVPLFEPVGLLTGSFGAEGTILGYKLSPAAAVWILLGSVLGLVVTLSAYLFIGATSGTTYSVIAHVKTVVVVGCGVALFGDSFQMRKALGLVLTLGGIAWYTLVRVQEQQQQQRANTI